MANLYAFMGETITLEPDQDYVAVRFRGAPTRVQRAFASARAGLTDLSDAIEIPGEKFTIYPVGRFPKSFGGLSASVVKALEHDEDVVNVVPVFKVGDRRVVATDRVLAGIADGAAKAFAYLSDRGCEIIENRDGDRLIRIPETENAFDIANSLLTFEGVSYAEPDFVTLGRHVALNAERVWEDQMEPDIALPLLVEGEHSEMLRSVSLMYQVQDSAPAMLSSARANSTSAVEDPLLKNQYAVRITGADAAWQSIVGNPHVRIAILDEGVDASHEDLSGRIVGIYDGISDTTNSTINSWDGHGTACAGLAAAIPDNGLGIRGIGGGCSLLAIRIAESPQEGKSWYTTNSIIGRSIDWAWQNGADVLSNSWGGGAPSTAIFNAFERARTKGRNGKGVVIVVAAGNDSGPVSFPANMPNFLTVSASNEYDEFKTKTSRDGEYWWGSNFGPEISVSAPGVHNLTTDISNTGGYALGNYTDFNGTSSACPVVAGAVGLLLSVNTNLSEADVRRIIQDSADKVDRYPYVNGRNDQHGHGRLNVEKSVLLVHALPAQ